jgi:hypothetical protein
MLVSPELKQKNPENIIRFVGFGVFSNMYVKALSGSRTTSAFIKAA